MGVSIADSFEMLDNLKIQQFMTRDPRTVACHESVATAADLMREHKIRHLPVMQGNKLVGILSERDIAIVESIQSTDPKRITVTEAMTANPYVCSLDTGLRDVAVEMINSRIGAALVIEQGKVVGIYTTVDALRTLIDLVAQENKV